MNIAFNKSSVINGAISGAIKRQKSWVNDY
jgi:hypothetical protein